MSRKYHHHFIQGKKKQECLKKEWNMNLKLPESKISMYVIGKKGGKKWTPCYRLIMHA